MIITAWRSGACSAGLVPVLDHRLRRLCPGVVDVQPVVGLVVGERRAGFARSDLLPCLALPLVPGTVHLGQLGGGDLALELLEQAARVRSSDELRAVTGEHELAFALARQP